MKSTQHSLVCTSHTISFVYQHICAKYTSLHPGPQKSPLLWTCVEDMNSCKALSFRNVIYHGRKKPLTASLSVSNNELHIHRSEVRGHKRDCPPSLMQCGKLEPTCLDKIKQRLSLRSNRNKLCSQIPHPECTSLTSQPEERTTDQKNRDANQGCSSVWNESLFRCCCQWHLKQLNDRLPLSNKKNAHPENVEFLKFSSLTISGASLLFRQSFGDIDLRSNETTWQTSPGISWRRQPCGGMHGIFPNLQMTPFYIGTGTAPQNSLSGDQVASLKSYWRNLMATLGRVTLWRRCRQVGRRLCRGDQTTTFWLCPHNTLCLLGRDRLKGDGLG